MILELMPTTVKEMWSKRVVDFFMDEIERSKRNWLQIVTHRRAVNEVDLVRVGPFFIGGLLCSYAILVGLGTIKNGIN